MPGPDRLLKALAVVLALLPSAAAGTLASTRLDWGSKAPMPTARARPRLVDRLVLALLMASLLILPPPLGTSAPTPALAATVGEIYIADAACCVGNQGGVIRVDPTTGAQTIVSQGGNFVDPVGIAIAENGDLFVVDVSCCNLGVGGVIRVNPTTGVQTVVTSGSTITTTPRAPVGMAIAVNGDLFVVDVSCCGGNQGGVFRANPSTGTKTIVSSGGNFVDPVGIAMAVNGDLLVTDLNCCGGNGGVFRVNPFSGAQTVVSSGGNFVDPFGIAMAANGDLLVTDLNCCGGIGGVIRVNPFSGAQTVVSSGNNFISAYGIAIAPNGDLLVVDSNCCGGNLGGVIRVNPTSGAQTVVSSGGNFVDPRAIAIAPALSIDSPSVIEGPSGTTNLTFTVSLALYTSHTVRVDYATVDGTAEAGSDYAATSGTLTFAPGETTKTITVIVTGDTVFEPDETVVVNLTNPSGANLIQAQVTGTIQNDDDPPPTISITGSSVPEGNSGITTAVFSVSLSAPSSRTVTVQYATADGTAQAGSDYAAISGTLTFAPGIVSQTVGILILGDTLVEPDETFIVTLSSPTNATIATAQAAGTIQTDDIAPTPTSTVPPTGAPPGPGGPTPTPTPPTGAPPGPVPGAPAAFCNPRPNVAITTVPVGAGQLQATIIAQVLPATPSNSLLRITIARIDNATVLLNGGPLPVGVGIPLPGGTSQVALQLQRQNPAAASMVSFIATDICGDWPSFVGGGPGAF